MQPVGPLLALAVCSRLVAVLALQPVPDGGAAVNPETEPEVFQAYTVSRTELARECAAGQRLVYLHIPKTGGCSIEDTGRDNGILWGRYANFTNCGFVGHCGDSFHEPPDLLTDINMYTTAKVFCSIRNPFDRAVSEFKWRMHHGKAWGHLPGKCSAHNLNRWLHKMLRLLKNASDLDEAYFEGCHMLPQHRYIWGPGAEQRGRNCHEIIRMEDFPSSFNELMRRYDYPFQMGGTRSNVGNCSVTTNDLDPVSLQLLREVYVDDFRLLNYSPVLRL